MTIKQGTVLPSTGIGVAYLFLLIYLINAWQIGFIEMLKLPLSYLLIISFSLMQFSYKDFIINENDTSYFTYRYRLLGIIPIDVNYNFELFNLYVLKVISKAYNVKQGAASMLVVNEGTHNEKYLALVARNIKTKNVIEIVKGKKRELDLIIKFCILPLKIPIYLGAPKQGWEYSVN